MEKELNKLKRSPEFDIELNTIKNLKFLPFVGQEFKKSKTKIMVFAHNIPISSDKFDHEISKMSKTHFSSSMGQYINTKEKWNKPFRDFIKASVNLKTDYNLPLIGEELKKIESFTSKISHINYIHEPIKSDKRTNLSIDSSKINLSNQINIEILEKLEITHIVCWGKNVFDYILNINGITITEKWINFEDKVGLTNLKGFGYAKININGRDYFLLKTFHPSMPGFKKYNPSNHQILNWFYNL